jgi:hypothetical protein
LFPPGFWAKHFADIADVDEVEEICPPDKRLSIAVRRLLRRHWENPEPIALRENKRSPLVHKDRQHRHRHLFERALTKIGTITGLSRVAPKQPSEFGLFVKMTPQMRNDAKGNLSNRPSTLVT